MLTTILAMFEEWYAKQRAAGETTRQVTRIGLGVHKQEDLTDLSEPEPEDPEDRARLDKLREEWAKEDEPALAYLVEQGFVIRREDGTISLTGEGYDEAVRVRDLSLDSDDN